MSLKDTIKHLKTLLSEVTSDLDKSEGGNKAASQRVRTGTIKLEKIAKLFRKESVKAEKSGSLKKTKSSKAPKSAPKAAASKSSPKTKSSKSSGGNKSKSSSKSDSKSSSQAKRPTAKIIKKKK